MGSSAWRDAWLVIVYIAGLQVDDGSPVFRHVLTVLLDDPEHAIFS